MSLRPLFTPWPCVASLVHDVKGLTLACGPSGSKTSFTLSLSPYLLVPPAILRCDFCKRLLGVCGVSYKRRDRNFLWGGVMGVAGTRGIFISNPWSSSSVSTNSQLNGMGESMLDDGLLFLGCGEPGVGVPRPESHKVERC